MEYIKIRLLDDFGHIGSKFDKTIEEMFRSVSTGFNSFFLSLSEPIENNT